MFRLALLSLSLSALSALGACGSNEERDPRADSGAEPASGGQADAASDPGKEGDAEPTDTPRDAGAPEQTDASTFDASDAEAEAGTDAGAADAGDASGDSSDAAQDADTGDAADADAGPAFSLRVRRGESAPLANVPVLLHAADGALLAEEATSAEGELVREHAPAMLTVIVPKSAGGNTSGDVQLFTLSSLADGDAIVLELLADPPSQAPAQLPGYVISVPNTPPLPATTAKVAAYGGDACTAALAEPFTGSIALPWSEACTPRSSNSLLAIAFDSMNRATGYAYKKGVAAFDAAPLAVTLGGWMAPSKVTLTAKNLPPQKGAVGTLLLLSDGASFDPTDLGALSFGTGAANRSLTFPIPPGFADEQSAFIDMDGPLARQVSSLGQRAAPSATATLDLAEGLPGATQIMLDRQSPSRPSLHWMRAATPTNQADGCAVLLEWPTPWFVLLPGDSTELQLPELPEARRAFLGTDQTPAMYVSDFASSRIATYREFLAEPVRPLLQDSYHLLSRALPADTRVQAVSYSAQ